MNREEYINACKDLNVNITNEIKRKLDKFKYLVIGCNKKFNLTSILSEEEFYLKHFYDSICLIKAADLNKKLKLCDIGTGAGFPGIVLKIVFPKLNITLVESNTKKCEFLNFVIKELNLSNIEIINERAEIYSKKNNLKFDIVTSRAVAHTKILLELALPMLKINGLFVPLKGKDDAIIEYKNFIETLGGKLSDIIKYELPIEHSKRTIPVIIKIRNTNKLYPRSYNQILKDLDSR